MSQSPAPVVVLLSGRGSNLQAIIDETTAGRLDIDLRAVISNRAEAEGLQLARAAGIPTQVIEPRDYADRDQFDAALMQAIDAHAPRLVILAGFMRILGADFIQHYAMRLINIHPSLLPAFKGLNTHARVLDAKVERHGASVHFVTPDVDGGPLIIQSALAVHPNDTAESLAQRVLLEEHRIYSLAIQWFIAGRLTLDNGHVLLDGQRHPEQGLEPMALWPELNIET